VSESAMVRGIVVRQATGKYEKFKFGELLDSTSFSQTQVLYLK
jgi:hypothetical protein